MYLSFLSVFIPVDLMVGFLVIGPLFNYYLLVSMLFSLKIASFHMYDHRRTGTRKYAHFYKEENIGIRN